MFLSKVEEEESEAENPSYDPFDFHASRNTNKPTEKIPTHKTSTDKKTPTTTETSVPETSRTTSIRPTEIPEILTTEEVLVEQSGKQHPPFKTDPILHL